MSINNIYIVKEHNGKWYGWDEMAEESGVDHDQNGGKRILSLQKAHFTADSREELEKRMDDSYFLSPEYGYSSTYLADGTPVEFVDYPPETLSNGDGSESAGTPDVQK